MIDRQNVKVSTSMSQEDNALKVNMESAAEIARQLRLRDMGGLIVIDFIDMEDTKNRKAIYNAMRREMVRDRARNKIYELSELGLMQMTRQR